MDRHHEVPNQSPKSCNDGKMLWVDLLLTCDGTGVHSVPSFSKDAGSTNYFMVLDVQVSIKQHLAPK